MFCLSWIRNITFFDTVIIGFLTTFNGLKTFFNNAGDKKAYLNVWDTFEKYLPSRGSYQAAYCNNLFCWKLITYCTRYKNFKIILIEVIIQVTKPNLNRWGYLYVCDFTCVNRIQRLNENLLIYELVIYWYFVYT